LPIGVSIDMTAHAVTISVPATMTGSSICDLLP
jgi:hypothetical protein